MNINYENISEVAEAYSSDTANKYISMGWTLINVFQSESGPAYVLGWNKSNGTIKYPATSNAFDKLRKKINESSSN